MSRGATSAPVGRTLDTKLIEKWFVWYGVPHFVRDLDSPGIFLRLFLTEPGGILSLPIVRNVAWEVFQAVSLLRWVGRRIWYDVRHLRKEASRALPMLAVLTILGFFSNDLWHIASDMGYLRLLFVLIGFICLGLLFLDARLPEVIAEQLPRDRRFTDTEIAKAWENHHNERLPAWDGRPVAEVGQFDPAESRNMRVYLLLCQVIQVSLLSVVVGAFFLILGKLAFTNTLLRDWFPNGGAQYTAHVWFISVPFISTQLLRASILMAILTSVIFTVQAVVDKDYRKEFFDPTVNGLMEAVCIRCVYLALLNPSAVAHSSRASLPSESPVSTEPARPATTAN